MLISHDGPRSWSRPRRRVARALIAVVGAAAVSVATLAVPASAETPDSYILEGRGWGHGRGMGQYGALGYATGVAGTPWSSAQILDHFYGGTHAGTIPAGSQMTVRLLSRDTHVTVVKGIAGRLGMRRGTGAVEALDSSHVHVTVSGTNAFSVRQGSSCAGPWGAARTVSATELAIVDRAVSDLAFGYGAADDVPVTGDWNGDGVDTVGVFRDGVWYLNNSNSGGAADLSFTYGRAGDTPVVGDWNGDGIDTVGVRRDNAFSLRNSHSGGAAHLRLAYGKASDTPVVGDWNGDGIDTFGVRRGNAYYLRNSNSTGIADLSFGYGTASDAPVVGDWDGNRTDTPGVARPSGSGTDFLLRNSNTSGPAQQTVHLAAQGRPLSGAWTGGRASSVGTRSGQVFTLRNASTATQPLELCTTPSTTLPYRGELRAINYQGSQRTVNALPVDEYVRGVVPREVPPSWGTAGGGTGMAALEAQSVAARSYAWAENRYPYAKTCDTISCQVYGGQSAEHDLTDQAIANTARVVRLYDSNGAVARTEFSSSTGGHTVGPNLSPFTSVEDRGDAVAANSRHTWTREVQASALSASFCGGAAVTSLSVVARLPEDGYRRAKTVRIGCSTGPKDVTGDAFRVALGLFSTWFSVVDDPSTGPGVYRSGTFYLRAENTSGNADVSFAFGASGAIPLSGDWDGDGIDTIGYRLNQYFHLRNSNSAGPADFVSPAFGRSTDIPVVGDYDGDGDDDVGVRRGDDIYFLSAPSSAPVFTVTALEPTDRVIFGDWDRDGDDEVGWLRGTTFHLGSRGTVASPMAGVPFTAVVAADGSDTVGVFSNGSWRILAQPVNGAAVIAFGYGTSGDVPVTGRWFR